MFFSNLLERFPLGEANAPSTRTQGLHDSLLDFIARLEGAAPVPSPTPKLQSAVVDRALGDAEILIRDRDATSGVDRIHTALHGYLLAVCQDAGLTYPSNASLPTLFKLLRREHPALQATDARSQDITQVLRAFGAVLDALNPMRNKASVAHPNRALLDKPEAMLVVNAARTVLHYLDARLSRWSSSGP